jgi:predicted ATPase
MPGPTSVRPRADLETPMLGRDADLALVVERLSYGARLITLSGPFGVGKSRLARELTQRDVMRDGEALSFVSVDLSEVTRAEGLRDATLQALGRSGGKKSEAASIERVLAAAGALVLVLDPFDRLVREQAVLTRWLDVAPELSIVAVSREHLLLPEEVLVQLDPLSIEASIELFAALAARHRGGRVDPGKDERTAIAEIVRTLEGIPLAMELAAPRLSVMGVEALLHRLKNRWDVLKRSAPTPTAKDDRNLALETSLRWSLELLEPAARDVLEQATVFRGGFSIEAAEAVIVPPAGASVIDCLQALRARSLLESREARGLPGELRLSLLTSVRELAARAVSTEKNDALAERHAAHYVQVAEALARDLEQHGARDAQARLAAERDNLLAIVERILGQGAVSARAADRALRALCAVAPALVAEGAGEAVARYLEIGLSIAQGSGADPLLSARALVLRADVRSARGDAAGADRDLAEALVLANHAGDAALETRVVLALSALAIERGSASEARTGVGRARELAGSAADPHVLTRILALEGAIAEHARDAVGARLAYEEALARARALDSPSSEVAMRAALAMLDLREGALDAMGVHVGRGLACASLLADRASLAWLGALQGAHHQLSGALDRAIEQHRLVARDAREAGLHAQGGALSGLAGLAHAEAGDRGEARALFAEARVHARSTDADLAALFAIGAARLSTSAGRTAEADDAIRTAGLLTEEMRDPALLELVAGDPLALRAPELAARSGLVALALRVPASARQDAPAAPDPLALLVSAGAVWFRAPGEERVDLSKRKPLRLLLDRLADERLARPGAALPWDALLEVGWPGEKMRADAGAHRVRVAISTLRKMGLKELLATDERGYRLSETTPLGRG